MGIEDITATDLQDDIIGQIIIEEYKEQVAKRMNDEQYMNILAIYIRSVFQDFESFLRSQIDLVEDDIKLVLDEYNSSFITYEITPGIYTFKDISEALFNFLQSEYPRPSNVIDIEYDDITLKIKMIVGVGIIVVKFDEKSFFCNVLGFTSGWDYKHYIEYTSQKILNLGSTNKIHLKCDIINGSVIDAVRQSILYSFVLDKKPGFKVFSEPRNNTLQKNKKFCSEYNNFLFRR